MQKNEKEWIKDLPQARGRYQKNVSLAPHTWFRVGGPADVLFRPLDLQDLIVFLKQRSKDVPVTLLGNGSNLLVRDGGVPGVAIRLGKGFHHFFHDLPKNQIDVGAGALNSTFTQFCAQVGLGGLEFFSGIPGSIGGALRMNAGAYGTEVKDCLVEAQILDPKGEIHHLKPADLGYSHRTCSLPKEWIFVGARFQAEPQPFKTINQKIETLLEKRKITQPIREKTGGSTFKNPDGFKAWELIDQAGCRGFQVGGAEMSKLHCNFMINIGTATAHDLESLGEDVQQKVLEKTGVALCWEIERIGIQKG